MLQHFKTFYRSQATVVVVGNGIVGYKFYKKLATKFFEIIVFGEEGANGVTIPIVALTANLPI